MEKASHTILDAIGHTPLIQINHLNPNPRVKIYAKLEYLNPGGSIKDRASLYMIEAGEASGQLTPEKTVVEATSGNTGIGLAMVCAVKGYKLLLAMSGIGQPGKATDPKGPGRGYFAHTRAYGNRRRH